MNILLYFVFPISTIMLAIVFQKIIKSPILVAMTTFAIFLIVTYAVYDSSFLIYTIIYTILAFIAAYLTRLICKMISNNGIFNTISANTVNANTISTDVLNVDDNNNTNCCNRNMQVNRYRRY